MSAFEISHSRLRGCAINPSESCSCGIFTYTYNDFFTSLEVMGEVFCWSAHGHLISGPVKSLEEWVEWLNQMTVAFNESSRQEAA